MAQTCRYRLGVLVGNWNEDRHGFELHHKTPAPLDQWLISSEYQFWSQWKYWKSQLDILNENVWIRHESLLLPSSIPPFLILCNPFLRSTKKCQFSNWHKINISISRIYSTSDPLFDNLQRIDARSKSLLPSNKGSKRTIWVGAGSNESHDLWDGWFVQNDLFCPSKTSRSTIFQKESLYFDVSVIVKFCSGPFVDIFILRINKINKNWLLRDGEAKSGQDIDPPLEFERGGADEIETAFLGNDRET